MFNVRTNIDISTIVRLELTKRTMTKEVTGLLHISDRLLAGEKSRVEAARGTLQALFDRSSIIDNNYQLFVDKQRKKFYSIPT